MDFSRRRLRSRWKHLLFFEGVWNASGVVIPDRVLKSFFLFRFLFFGTAPGFEDVWRVLGRSRFYCEPRRYSSRERDISLYEWDPVSFFFFVFAFPSVNNKSLRESPVRYFSFYFLCSATTAETIRDTKVEIFRAASVAFNSFPRVRGNTGLGYVSEVVGLVFRGDFR